MQLFMFFNVYVTPHLPLAYFNYFMCAKILFFVVGLRRNMFTNGIELT